MISVFQHETAPMHNKLLAFCIVFNVEYSHPRYDAQIILLFVSLVVTVVET